jgi:hypothetical protein
MKQRAMGGGGGMQEIVRQAARLQRKMEQAREEVKDVEVEAIGAGGKVKAVVTCSGQLKRLELDEAFAKEEGFELALAALAAAVNSAFEVAEKQTEEHVSKATGGLKLPTGF